MIFTLQENLRIYFREQNEKGVALAGILQYIIGKIEGIEKCLKEEKSKTTSMEQHLYEIRWEQKMEGDIQKGIGPIKRLAPKDHCDYKQMNVQQCEAKFDPLYNYEKHTDLIKHPLEYEAVNRERLKEAKKYVKANVSFISSKQAFIL